MEDETQQLVTTTLAGTDDSDSHVMMLFAISLGMKAKTIVELGVRKGSTTLPLLMAAKLTDGYVTSVDCSPTSFICPPTYSGHWTFEQSDTLEFLQSWDESRVIDLVLVDDWHAYDHVKHELELLDKLVSPASVILLHDLMYAGWAPHYHCDLHVQDGQWAMGGPYRAVAELDQNFWEFATLPYCNGLTILRKKYSTKYHA